MPESPPATSASTGGRYAHREVHVPYGVRLAAAWTWRVGLIAAGLYALVVLLATLQVIVVPVLVSVLLSALLMPLVTLLRRRARLPVYAAAAVALLSGLTVVIGLFTLVGQQIATGFSDLRTQVEEGLLAFEDLLVNGPLDISSQQLSGLLAQARAQVSENSQQLVSGALQFTATAGHVLTGMVIALFATFFFLADGRHIWGWLVRLLPRGARGPVNGAGHRAWVTLTAYVRATIVVALVDGLGIGLGAALLSVPFAFPLGVLVFLGAFVPIVGATVAGSVAVLVALVSQGPVVALLMLAVVIGVQQLEGHVLQPFLLGRAVSVHPLAVILAIAAGVLTAGVVGALFAVPLIAVSNTVVQYLAGRDDGGPDARAEGETSDRDAEAGAANDPPPSTPDPAASRSRA